MTEWVTGVVETVGYPGIALLMALEIFLPVVQSEIVMTFSGFASSAGELDLAAVVLAGVVGSQLGSVGLYLLATRLPEHRVRRVVADHGAWLGLTDDGLRSLEQRFSDHDGRAVLVGRLLPGLRSFIAVPAGLLGMPLPRFFAYNLVGTAFWVTVLAVAGSLLGQQYQLVDRYSSWVTAAFVALVVLAVAQRVRVVRRHRYRREDAQR